MGRGEVAVVKILVQFGAQCGVTNSRPPAILRVHEAHGDGRTQDAGRASCFSGLNRTVVWVVAQAQSDVDESDNEEDDEDVETLSPPPSQESTALHRRHQRAVMWGLGERVETC